MNISIIGLGKLGSPMAAVFAAKGHRVIGVDVNERYVRAINDGQPPVFEPGLGEMLGQGGGRLSATMDTDQAVQNSDITFVIVPTPSQVDGAFSLKHVLSAAEPIGRAIKNKTAYHTVVLTSTVMPGATGGELLPALERASGKRCPQDFGLCYSPEFISLGSVIRDYLHPDFVLIGESDPASGARLSRIYEGVCENRPPVRRMNFVNAELTKLALNAFVTMKISYANMLADFCERLDGGNVDVVTQAIGLDTRIGSKYLKGSVAFGGPCFPRDSSAMSTLAKRLDTQALLPQATDKVNAMQVSKLAELVQLHLPPGGKAGVLGLAYKPQTDVIERSQGVELAQMLLKQGVAVVAHDPVAMDNAKKSLSGDVHFASTPADCARQADVLVICSPCGEFKSLAPTDLARKKGRATVIDCWRLLDREKVSSVCHYVAIGTSDVLAARKAARQESQRHVARAA